MGLFSSSTSSSASNPLWDLQAQHLPGIYDSARNIYNQGAPGYYPGSTVAGFDPVRAQGLNLGVDAALGSQQQLSDAYTSGILGIAQGTDPTTQRLAQQAGAAVGQSAAGAGALGSARGQLAQNTAAGDVIANRQLQALQQIPQAQAAAITPAQTLTGIGTQFQDYQQQVTDADKQRYDYTANQPYNWLNQYRNVIGTPQAPTSQTDTESPSLFNSITGGISALSGLGLFAQGGEIPGYQTGGETLPTQRTAGAAPGIYDSVQTVPTYSGGRQNPQSNYGWGIVDGRYQLVPSAVGTQPGGMGQQQGGYTPAPIEFNPSLGHTTVGSGSGGVDYGAGGSGSFSLPNFTTYGGHRDVAHQNIDQAFADYGQQILAGVAKPEDNPAYSAETAAANRDTPVVVGRDASGNPMTKTAGELTSADYQTEAYNNLSYEEKLAANYAALAASGIKNVGGGYNQPDQTGILEDAWTWGRQTLGNVIRPDSEDALGAGIRTTVGDYVAVAPESTYDSSGGNDSGTSGGGGFSSGTSYSPGSSDAAAASSYTGSNDDYTSSRIEDFATTGNFSGGFATGGEVLPSWKSFKNKFRR